jgi:hypothetical protein
MKYENPEASLESLLRSAPLRGPSDALDTRVNATFAQYRFKQPRRFQIYKMALAAGLLIALGIGVHIATKKAPPVAVVDPPKVNPIQMERDTSTVIDEGIIASTGDAAYQQFRRRTVREIWYINPGTHAEMLVTIPSDEIFIQKVEAY